MAAEETEDTEVAFSAKSRAGNSGVARGMIHESVDPNTGDVKLLTGKAAEADDVAEGGERPRRFKDSTLALLDKLAEGGEGEGDEEDVDPDDVGLVEGDEASDDGEDGEGDEGGDGSEETTDNKPNTEEVVNEWQQKATQYEEANARLVAELDAARKVKPVQRSEYEQTLVDAYQAYVDEGSVPALRKFVGAVLGAAPDSKEVTAELAGLYVDLTAEEVGVPLDESQQAKREAARAKLQLARDKRERAESEKKTAAPVDSDEERSYAEAGRYIENIITVKNGQSETSISDEYPLMVALAEDFDGYKPGELLARTIKLEVKKGVLTGRESEDVMIRHAARKIENYYDAVLKKADTARQRTQKSDTTKSGNAAAKPASKEKRQSTGAPTINNAKASVAPSTPPKTKQEKQKTKDEPPKFKSNKERQDWALRHIPK